MSLSVEDLDLVEKNKQPLTCLQSIKDYVCSEALKNVPKNILEKPFKEVLEKHFGLFCTYFQYSFKVPVIILQKSIQNNFSLLFDNRHFVHNIFSIRSSKKILCFQFYQNTCEITFLDGIHQLPKLSVYGRKQFSNQMSFWKLAQLSEPCLDPQTPEEAISILKKFNLLGTVTIKYSVVKTNLKHCIDYWNIVFGTHQISIEAFITKHFKIGYRLDVENVNQIISPFVETGLHFTKKNELPFLPLLAFGCEKNWQNMSEEEMEIFTQNIYQEEDERWSQFQTLPDPPDEFQNCASAAVSIKHVGLNELFNLGVITEKQKCFMSKQLAKISFASLWIETDKANNAVFVTYRDNLREKRNNAFIKEKPKHFLIDNQPDSWNKVFNYIEQRRLLMITKKKQLFANQKVFLNCKKFLVRFENKTVFHPWKKVLCSLSECIKQIKIVTYSVEDEILHLFKSAFTRYAHHFKGKQFRGVSINATAANDLCMMKIPEMLFFNMYNYLEINQLAPNFVDEKNPLPKPEIECFKELKVKNTKAKKQFGFKPYMLCKKRGVLKTAVLLEAWINMGFDFYQQFGMDIFSIPYTSFSKLSYNGIYNKFAQNAGFLHHGLSKLKLFYEDVLRAYSHGGFSFSCMDVINEGEKLFPAEPNVKNMEIECIPNNRPNLTHIEKLIKEKFGNRARSGEEAAAFVEFDINSSYGYAASEMLAPSGFCVGYTSTTSDNPKKKLIRSDKLARHLTFEFRSVYLTIFNLLAEGKKIRTVYSNYHPFGFLSIGKMPLDLVIIFENGNIAMWNFDGAYVHGCEKCKSLDRYVGNKSKEQVIEKTKKRDEKILNWVKQVNKKHASTNFVEYKIVSDCHDADYSKEHLNVMFKMHSELNNLVNNYLIKKSIDIDDVLYCSDDLTYFAIVFGFIPSSSTLSPGQVKPLFHYNEKALHGTQNCGEWLRLDSTKDECSQKGILVTKQYLDFLRKEFNFQVTGIEKVYFFKNSNQIPLIYQNLIETRAQPNISEGKKKLIKKTVNYSAGYFGFNTNKNETQFNRRYYVNLPKGYELQVAGKPFKYVVELVDKENNFDEKSILMISRPIARPQIRKPSNFPLPLFVTIVEMGKLRLAQFLSFLDQNLRSTSFRHCYSHVDNCLVVFSSNNWHDCIAPGRETIFHQQVDQFVHSERPGGFKIAKFISKEQRWSFCTPKTQNHVVVTADASKDYVKSAALQNLGCFRSFRLSLELLKKHRVNVVRQLRTNKLLGRKTHQKILRY